MAGLESRIVVSCLRCFLISLVFCCLLSSVLAVPATRSLQSIKLYSSIHGTVAVPQIWKRRRSAVESKFVQGRMNIELNDYPGPGANKGHEPVTPTKA